MTSCNETLVRRNQTAYTFHKEDKQINKQHIQWGKIRSHIKFLSCSPRKHKVAQTLSSLGNKNLWSAFTLLYYVIWFSTDHTLLFPKLISTGPGFYWEPEEPLTSDIQHGGCDCVQGLVRNFSGVIHLAVLQRESAHRTLHLDVTGLMITLRKCLRDNGY